MTTTMIALMSAFASLTLASVMLAATAALAWRRAQRRASELESAVLPAVSDAIVRLEGLLQDSSEKNLQTLDKFAADLSAMRAEVEWLGGNWMIDEAIRMCREGIPSDRIGEQLGMTQESLRVLSLLRTH